MKDSCGDENIMYFDCIISVNILVVILQDGFARHYYWGKLGKGYTWPLCILFLIAACEHTIIFYKFLKILYLIYSFKVFCLGEKKSVFCIFSFEEIKTIWINFRKVIYFPLETCTWELIGLTEAVNDLTSLGKL